MTNMDNDSRLALLGFSICEDGLYRRLRKHDSLAVKADGYRVNLYAESDDQSVRIQIASLPADCGRLAQIVWAIG
jgi:hypothetical protein